MRRYSKPSPGNNKKSKAASLIQAAWRGRNDRVKREEMEKAERREHVQKKKVRFMEREIRHKDADTAKLKGKAKIMQITAIAGHEACHKRYEALQDKHDALIDKCKTLTAESAFKEGALRGELEESEKQYKAKCEMMETMQSGHFHAKQKDQRS